MNIKPITELDSKIGVTPNGRLRYLSDRPVCEARFEMYAVRHGKTLGNSLKILQGDADLPVINQLNEEGRADALNAAGTLDDLLRERILMERNTIVVTSFLTRTKESTVPFIKVARATTGESLAVSHYKDANEISFGVMANTPYEQPTDDIKMVLESFGLATKVMSEAQNNVRMRWMDGDASIRFEGGESTIDLLIRTKRFIDDLNADFPSKTIAFFGHGTGIGCMRILTRRDMSDYIGIDEKTGEDEVILWRKKGFELRNGEVRQIA